MPNRPFFTAAWPVALAAIGFAATFWLAPRCWDPGMIGAAGGTPMQVGPLAAPHFLQDDPRWGDDALGPTTDRFGNTGCAVASAAMAMAFYGADTDPGRLNAALAASAGYTPRGWLFWEAAPPAAGVAQGVSLAYEGPASHRLMDANLARGNPVIVRVRLASGITHFVLAVGKRGREYLVLDPSRASPGRRLSDVSDRVEAIRFYRRATPAEG